MSLKSMKKEELELLSNKDIAYMILEESKKKVNTADLFKKIIKLLDLPESTFEKKVADFYTELSTDKRFIFLEDSAEWDLRNRHTAEIVVTDDDDDEEETLDEEEEEEIEEENLEDDIDSVDSSEDDLDDDDDIGDLSIITDEELEES